MYDTSSVIFIGYDASSCFTVYMLPFRDIISLSIAIIHILILSVWAELSLMLVYINVLRRNFCYFC